MTGPATSISDSIEKIKALTKLVNDMVSMLRSQRDLLAQRRINLPDGPLEELEAVGTDLSQVSQQFVSEQIELQQLRELARISSIINSILDLNLILNDVIDTVIMLIKAERGYIILRDVDSGALDYRVARNFKQHDLSDDEFTVSRTVIEHVAETGEPLITTNAEHDPRFNGSDSIANYTLRSILCVPLRRKGQVTGVIYADNKMFAAAFGDREGSLVYAFANQAAIAIDNARLFENVRASLAEITSIKDFTSNIFNSIASGVIAADGQDIITTINEAAARILEIPREASIGQSLWSVMPAFYERFAGLLSEVRERHIERIIEIDAFNPGRGPMTLSLKLSPLQDAAEVTQGVTLVLEDLTELRQRQAQVSLIRRYLPSVDNIKVIDGLELGGVEREISIVYCDVRNFTPFSQNLDPEELMLTINKYMSVSSEAITLFEGIIDKYMGDAVVGLYNTQLNPLTDHAIRAVRSAMAMAHDVLALHETLPDDRKLMYGIGVHTGTAILGNVGSPTRKEFTAIGDSLQYAKLLQENAAGGEVILSPATYELVKDVIAAEPIKPPKPKDYPGFTLIYRVTGVIR